MTSHYRPSNGTEGMMFMREWCDRCVRERPTRAGKPEDGCPILCDTFMYDVNDVRYPKEWVYDTDKMRSDGFLTIGGNDGARCTAFEEDKEARG